MSIFVFYVNLSGNKLNADIIQFRAVSFFVKRPPFPFQVDL